MKEHLCPDCICFGDFDRHDKECMICGLAVECYEEHNHEETIFKLYNR